MSRSDLFARFLAGLTEQLESAAPPGSNAALAARLYLSRSHLDRIVAAVAGETAGRFRRRILLERAAFRLRTAPTSVLDVAVEAGFGSAEAFTRAFRRAYGVAPTQWRSAAGGFRLPAPGGVHFHPPGGLRLPPRPVDPSGVATMAFVPSLLEHHITLLGALLDRAAALDDDHLDAPIVAGGDIDDAPTIRSVLARLVGQLAQWSASMANQPYDHGAERTETVAGLRERLDRAAPPFLAYVRGVADEDRYDETFVDATAGTPYVFTAAGMIGHVLTYAAYRRTVVGAALARAGTAELDDDPLSWFPG